MKHDLDIHRKEISKLLAQEIIKRYYFQAGQIEYSLKSDETIDRAELMFVQPGEYEKILNIGKKSQSKATKPQSKKKAKRA